MRHLKLSLMCGCVAMILLSCQSALPPSAKSSRRVEVSRALTGDAVPAPPGVDEASLARRKGDELAKAQMTLEQIVAALPVPDYLKADEAVAASAPPPGEDLPLAVQRAYLEGRQAWRDGRNFDAVQALQRAQRLAPQAPQILRLLGKIYSTSGNRVRGAQLLEQAIRIDPNDVESLVHLAMYAQDQGRFGDAIATFMQAMKLANADQDVDPAVQPLAHFYLGNALEREGYDAAAIAQYRPYLELPRHFSRSTAMVRELAFLYRQRGATWQTVGDLHNRLDQTEQALAAYQSAMEYEVSDPLSVMARAMYTHLRRGEAAAARDACMQVVRQAPAEPRTMSLLRYMIDVGAASPSFAERLDEVYRANNRPAPLALTIAAMLPSERAAALLREHLATKPGDGEVYRSLLTAQWTGKADDAAGATAAIRTTVGAIGRNPATAREYAVALLTAAESPDVVITRLDALTDGERQSPAARYLRGVAMLMARHPDDATVELRAAIAGDSRLNDARVALAGLLLAQDQFDEAAQLLDDIGPTRDSAIIAMRVKVLAQTNRHDEALALLDTQLVSDPTNLDLVLEKAGLQLRMGDAVAAERTLLDALNLQPSAERIYEALFALYDSPAAPPDSVRQYQRLMRRALNTIPHSRIARLQRAKLHDARGEFREADQLLRGLLEENPDDLNALDTLLDVLVRADRRGEADTLIDTRIAEAKDNRDLLRIAQRHYTRTGNTAKATQVFEQLLLQEPDSAQKARALAAVYLGSGRPGQAMDVMIAAIEGGLAIDDPTGWVAILGRAATKSKRIAEADPHIRKLIDRFPEHEADLLFEWAMVLERRGEKPRAEQTMVDLLAKHPDHAPTNNGLGYTWANEGRNLDKAHTMIQSAVDADANAAYLDSLGWVLYKKGRFEEAVQWLRRGKNEPGGDYPVIIDHLGDALYRLGRPGEAMREWKAAQQALAATEQTADDDPELAGMAERLKAKLDAAANNRPAPIAAVPGDAGEEPAPDDDADAAVEPQAAIDGQDAD